MRLTEPQIKTASKWWADKLRRPSFNNGDTSLNGGMAAALAGILAKDPGEETVKAFEESLAFLLKMTSNEDGYIDLSVDYHPSRDLYMALSSAGVKAGIATLPCKTWMRFTENGVEVAEGYGSQLVELELVQ